MSDSEQRTSILGSEIARRGLIPVPEPVLFAYAAALMVSMFLFVFFGSTIWTLAGVLAVVGGTLWATTDMGGRRSWAGEKLHRIRDRRRRRRGEHVYRAPGGELYGVLGADPGWEFPVPLGDAAPLDLTDTGLDDMFILEHRTPGDNNYYSVVLSIQGLAEGLRGAEEWAVTSQAFSRTLASFARRSSLLRGLEMVHRSVPADLTPHVAWMESVVRANPNAARVMPAVESYGQLIDGLAPESEEHRCYATLVFPKSVELLSAAGAVAKRKGVEVRAGIGQVIVEETMRAVGALTSARLGQVQVLGQQRACAVFRSMLDPSYALDAHRGASWGNCWPSYVGGDLSARVSDRWDTRVGLIRPGSIEPIPLHAEWLSPLLTGVDPDPGDPIEGIPAQPTIRTVKVRMDFVDAVKARQVARKDATEDAARQYKERKKGQVTDGASEVMASASLRRREDLKPGSGHHGVIWSMAVSVTAPDEDAVMRACARLEQAADQAAIKEFTWFDDSHDVAQFLTLPLGRGLAATKYTRAKGV
ncbi:SCO6880 family protein [Rhodococcus aetherivorans]|uniref:SCO6880 family protein n=1 Tax=Rhodococcus aetherivorans TaxID=191292 RepID=UPI003EBB44DB